MGLLFCQQNCQFGRNILYLNGELKVCQSKRLVKFVKFNEFSCQIQFGKPRIENESKCNRRWTPQQQANFLNSDRPVQKTQSRAPFCFASPYRYTPPPTHTHRHHHQSTASNEYWTYFPREKLRNDLQYLFSHAFCLIENNRIWGQGRYLENIFLLDIE